MVLQERLNYGFDGYQVPPIPRAARSLRRRGPLRKKVVDNQMCAFDLLATVAGKILLEGQTPNTPSSTGTCQGGSALCVVKEEQQLDDCQLLNIETCNQSSLEIGLVVDKHGLQVQNQPSREIMNPQGGFSSGSAFAITTPGCAEKIGFDAKKGLNDGSSQYVSCLPTLEDQPKEQFQSQPINNSEPSFGIGSDTCSSEDPKLLDPNPPALVKSDSGVKVRVHESHHTCGFPAPCRNNVNLVSKDDDDNSSQCSQKSTVVKTSRSTVRMSDRRLKKLLTSRYWRAPPKVKDGDISDTGAELHCVYRNWKNGFKRQRSQRIYPFKKRKLFYSLPSTSAGTTGSGCKGTYKPHEKGTDTSASDFAAGAFSGAAGQNTSFTSGESHVKLRIKSFRVPELFIELPETATVGSLKKTVMDAITTLLGGGLRIGVVVQGRKIRDDNRTLLQTGISRDNKVDSLGFTLEPNPSQVYAPVCSEEPSIQAPQPVSRLAPGACIAHPRTHVSSDNQANNLTNFIESDHDSVPSPADVPTETGTADSKALVALPEANVQPLAAVPPLQKSKQSETAQRRIRRPFSVAEVEALVQAVEKLGTGRWRDVKLGAFDNVKHRTYVDLKDKWKTLVHTARISPQQRRGEPVPQELLDRVLAAHAYWSQQQAKQQLKQQSEACLLI